MAQFFKVVWGTAKALPALYKLINEFILMWQKQAIEQVDRVKTTHEQKLEALINSVSRAQTSEERRALSIVLHDTIHGK